ncbi:WavE lipopolysaccharide synthesis family protein [Delftia tsuruhatensis]|uniref:WavE lipopolysaccharide synthesis family protein n=1 Tax=Delftia tsuruhatensis TaxID=180282 RepID=UPI0031DE22E4
MAEIIGSLERVLLRYPDLDIAKLRVVGWGAGEFFKKYYPLISSRIKLEYTVCPWQENQGRVLNGAEVRSPEALMNEDPGNTLILVFSYDFSERLSEITYGEFRKFKVMRAVELDVGDVPLMDELQERQRLMDGLSMARSLKGTPKAGIFVQGLAFDFTPQVLAWNRMRFPSAYQCMVTWDHQPRELLDRCRPWLDALILVAQPENKGRHNTNYIARSARLGVEHLAQKGIEYAVRCRSDNLLTGSSIHEAIQHFFAGGRNKGKIAIDLRSGWRHVPFHFSEKTMLARTEDMVRLWSVPEDRLSEADIEHSAGMHFQKLADVTMESYLWKSYARSLGFAAETLKDSYRFAHDRLLPINSRLDWFSYKFIPLFNVKMASEMCFRQSDWDEMMQDQEFALQRASDISALDVSVREFWQRKID